MLPIIQYSLRRGAFTPSNSGGGGTSGPFWQGILATSRAIDWSTAGVQSGIPTRNTIFSTMSAGVTAAQINSAISACPASSVVFLNAGTYNLTTGLTFSSAAVGGVTLRGAGANQTFLIFSDNNSCLGQIAFICIPGSNLSYYGPGPPTNSATWIAPYDKGTTTIALTAISGTAPVVGQFIYVDQLKDTTDTGNIYDCNTAGVCVQQGGTINGRTDRILKQMVKVTAVTTVSGTTSCNITPAIYPPNYRSAQTPGAFWGDSTAMIHGCGVENLSIDGQSVSGGAMNVSIIFAYDCWVKGVRSICAPSPRAHLTLYQSAHCSVVDSYFVGSRSDADSSLNYGVDSYGSADCLVQNNICQHRTTGFISNGDQGTVWSYNFDYDNHYTANNTAPGFQQAEHYSHESGNGMTLREGNSGIGMKFDTIHGTSNLMTAFRNYLIGFDNADNRTTEAKTAQTSPIMIHTNQRYHHFIGNVLGDVNYHTSYASIQTGNDFAIYQIDLDYGGIPPDGIVELTMMRWGNWDTVHSSAVYNSSEVPSGIAVLPNPVPATTTLPSSFYLTSRPAWFGYNGTSVTWPPIGPDVTGGTVTSNAGHVYKIPAQLNFEAMAIDTLYTSNPAKIRVFDAATAYQAT